MSYYGVMKALLSKLVLAFRRVRTEGAENVEKGKTYLVCANHICADDPIVLGAALPCQLKYMAKKELISIPVAGWFMKTLGAYPVDRGGSDAAAVKKTVSFLKDGQCVLMFPQGTRMPGKDPADTVPKPGCAMIAARAGVDVLPILIETKGYRQRFLKRTVVRIGEPIKSEAIAEANVNGYAEAARMIFGRITRMEDKAYLPSKENE